MPGNDAHFLAGAVNCCELDECRNRSLDHHLALDLRLQRLHE